MPNKLNLISILIILVLILIKIAPKVIDLVHKKKASQFSPYAFFKVESLSMKMFTRHTQGEVKFQQYFNQLGLYVFLLELDKMIRYNTDGEKDLQSALKEVEKLKKEGSLVVDERADEES